MLEGALESLREEQNFVGIMLDRWWKAQQKMKLEVSLNAIEW